ncbi:lysylphosphatidylglycerol synthase transmembrane domain-containing protein [Novosphingobium sp. G106]|uniref:lysylphosphatidylglycerol synthase transmembrane domain-containing protein n=1 Tax=Novosphingobium sp. G106 TaxID=2849500 RepID=UPI002112428E
MARKSRPQEAALTGWRAWFFGLLLLAALFGAVAHWGEIQRFAALARHTRPGWLALALGFQLSTYLCVANGWRAVLERAGTPRGLGPLMRIAVTKLFADQVLPTAGIGGNVLLVDQLRRIGVSSSTSVAALLLSMVGFYAAYGLFAVAMLVLLWLHDQATPLMAGLVTIFLVIALGIPGLALWLRHRGSRPLPRRLERIGFMRSLLEAVGEAPSRLLRDRVLIARVTGWNALIFLADAGTFFACLHGLGQDASFATAFIALIMASMMVTLGPIPLGLGSFETTATATLRLLGVPFEAAVTATLLLRLLTLWLPLLPGLVLMRKAVKKRTHSSRRPSHAGKHSNGAIDS